MRYISLDDIEQRIPPEWQQRAKEALAKLTQASEGDRAAVIAAEEIWKDLKELLWRASKMKCWYCESIDSRSDNAVDHFRPKNRVKEAAESTHSGYWWLAFDWRNYRFSCTYCNSYRKSATGGGGKHDHFPLWEERKRAVKPEDALDDEQPMLLDPTCAQDVGEIVFTDNGRPVPAVNKEENLYRFSRAYESIKIYHLDEPRISERRGRLMKQIRKQLIEANKFLRKVDGRDRSAEQAYADKIAETMHALRRDAEYSAAARFVVASLRGEFPWADRLLTIPI